MRQFEADDLKRRGFTVREKTGKYSINANVLGVTASGSEIDEYQAPGDETWTLCAHPTRWPKQALRVRLADGRVYTGRQALTAKLIDELGGEERAIAWLEAQEDFPAGLKVSDWAPAGSGELSGLGFSIGRGLARAFGLEGLADSAAIHKLDGLLVLWHPDL